MPDFDIFVDTIIAKNIVLGVSEVCRVHLMDIYGIIGNLSQLKLTKMS